MQDEESKGGLRGLWQSLDQRERDQIRFLFRTLGVILMFVLVASVVAGLVVSIL
jgi:hypothetical protein